MKKYAKNQAKNSFLRASQKNYGFYVCLHTCITTLKPCFLFHLQAALIFGRPTHRVPY